jgi:threonine/homoserine/homoserine lactone efflux protein
MPDIGTLALFLLAASALAITPGPGIAYVAARTLAGGRREGIASSFGTALGGSVHILAGALGVSALVLASAEAFTLLKLVGAAYLVWIGIKTIREAGAPLVTGNTDAAGSARAFRDGIVIEVLNPKTAAFFLAFIPQFISPDGDVLLQFAALGFVVVFLNTAVDVVVAFVAGRARETLVSRPALITRVRQGSGALMCGLGVLLAVARRPG